MENNLRGDDDDRPIMSTFQTFRNDRFMSHPNSFPLFKAG